MGAFFEVCIMCDILYVNDINKNIALVRSYGHLKLRKVLTLIVFTKSEFIYRAVFP